MADQTTFTVQTSTKRVLTELKQGPMTTDELLLLGYACADPAAVERCYRQCVRTGARRESLAHRIIERYDLGYLDLDLDPDVELSAAEAIDE